MIEHEPATPTKRLRYVGENGDLYGNWYEVPAHIPLPQAANYIEQNFAGTTDAPAESSGQALEAAEESERSVAMDRFDEMQEQLQFLQDRLEQPDIGSAADAISSSARAMQSSWNISQELQKLEDQARSQLSRNQELQNQAKLFSEEAQKQQKKTTDLIKANQKIVNNSFSSFSGEIINLRKNLAEADHEIRMLKRAASENSALVKKAGSIVKAWEARDK